MTQINPFVGSVVQSTQVQRQSATDKDQQIRQQQDEQKATGTRADAFEHQVESADAITPIHEEQKDQPNKKRQHHHHDAQQQPENPDDHLDLTA